MVVRHLAFGEVGEKMKRLRKRTFGVHGSAFGDKRKVKFRGKGKKLKVQGPIPVPLSPSI